MPPDSKRIGGHSKSIHPAESFEPMINFTEHEIKTCGMSDICKLLIDFLAKKS